MMFLTRPMRRCLRSVILLPLAFAAYFGFYLIVSRQKSLQSLARELQSEYTSSTHFGVCRGIFIFAVGTSLYIIFLVCVCVCVIKLNKLIVSRVYNRLIVCSPNMGTFPAMARLHIYYTQFILWADRAPKDRTEGQLMI